MIPKELTTLTSPGRTTCLGCRLRFGESSGTEAATLVIPTNDMLMLVRSLTDDHSDVRERACGTVTDWLHTFDEAQVHLLASLLSIAAVGEDHNNCREAQLHALYELLDTGLVVSEDVTSVRRLDVAQLMPSELEYVSYMRETLLR